MPRQVGGEDEGRRAGGAGGVELALEAEGVPVAEPREGEVGGGGAGGLAGQQLGQPGAGGDGLGEQHVAELHPQLLGELGGGRALGGGAGGHRGARAEEGREALQQLGQGAGLELVERDLG
ncbi:MAG: hypothetical protein ACK559_13920, partial [bacterium]